MSINIITTPDDTKCWFCWAENPNKLNKTVIASSIEYHGITVNVEGKIKYCPACGKQIIDEDSWYSLSHQYAKENTGADYPWNICGSICNEKIIEEYVNEYKKQNEEEI